MIPDLGHTKLPPDYSDSSAIHTIRFQKQTLPQLRNPENLRKALTKADEPPAKPGIMGMFGNLGAAMGWLSFLKGQCGLSLGTANKLNNLKTVFGKKKK